MHPPGYRCPLQTDGGLFLEGQAPASERPLPPAVGGAAPRTKACCPLGSLMNVGTAFHILGPPGWYSTSHRIMLDLNNER